MTMDRHFLGWDKPCLHLAAAWLREKYERDGQLDLGHMLIALPGARAGRRLLEILTAERGLIGAPRIVTVGQLPEHLYESPRPQADALATLLARWSALRTLDRAMLEKFVPQPPDESDFAGWLALARELNQLDEELAGERWTFDAVAKRAFEMDVPAGDNVASEIIPQDDRWAVLAQIGDRHRLNLESLAVIDRHAARIEAIAAKQCATTRHVVLIGATDLNGMMRQMLEQVAANATGNGSGQVTPLIHAPQSEADSFDGCGCVKVDAWLERPIDIDDQHIRVVDSPAEQAVDVAVVIEATRLERGDEHVAADRITVGLGDESLSPSIERTLQQAGLATHSAVGTPLSQTRPAMLLAGVATFAERSRLDDFASLLRHSDVEGYLRKTLPIEHFQAGHPNGNPRGEAKSEDGEPGAAAAIRHWLALLDDYIADHLHVQPVSAWLGDEKIAKPLARVYDAVRALLPESLDVRRPLPAWSEAIGALCRAIYGDMAIDDTDPKIAPTTGALKVIADTLREQAAWDGQSELTPMITFADAVRFTLSRLGGQAVADPAGEGVELLGWLELQLDDAEQLIITGFNEGNIPASTHGDALLPNAMRSTLGLMHNDRRTARDAAALTAILHSRPHVSMLASRRGNDGEPLMPSRLLLRCPDAALPARIKRFYPKERPLRIMPIAWDHAEKNRLLIPAPQPLVEPMRQFHVTMFRHYLECPYRFYLRYMRKLKAVCNDAIELDALHFGNLIHDVLKAFGQEGPAQSAKLDEVHAYLDSKLAEVAIEKYGDDSSPTVRIQIEQARHRLASFARWQVAEVDAGWKMMPTHTEKRLTATLDVDGDTVEIVGRIDRIDRKGELYRVLDYKTGDSAKVPLSAHCKGARKRTAKSGDGAREINWLDLQLPLYHYLVRGLKIEKPTLGYVRLSKDPRVEMLAEADWIDAEIDSAIECAREVVRKVRAGVFWPPREPGQYDDEFSDLCLERHLGRKAVIDDSDPTRCEPGRGGGENA